MRLTKEKCEDSLSELYHYLCHYEECINFKEKHCCKCNIKEDLSVMRKLISEHFKKIEVIDRVDFIGRLYHECSNCRAKVDYDDKICPNCNKELNW